MPTGAGATRTLELHRDPRSEDCAADANHPNPFGNPYKLREECRFRIIQQPFPVNIPVAGAFHSLGFFGTLRRIWINANAAVTFGSLAGDALATLKARVWVITDAFRAVYHTQLFTPFTDGELSRVLTMNVAVGRKAELELLVTRSAAGLVTVTNIGGAIWGNDNSQIYSGEE